LENVPSVVEGQNSITERSHKNIADAITLSDLSQLLFA